jgi:Protein of unknown function (DUF1493)
MMTANSQFETGLYEKIRSFVLEETSTRKPISPQTDMEWDLGISGDDAAEFMLRFADEFDVDISGFRFNTYFGSEGANLIALVWSLLIGRRSRKPLTIGLLLEAAENNRWPPQA